MTRRTFARWYRLSCSVLVVAVIGCGNTARNVVRLDAGGGLDGRRADGAVTDPGTDPGSTDDDANGGTDPGNPGNPGDPDAAPVTGGGVYDDAASNPDGGCSSRACTTSHANGCVAQELCGDGLDNNCNGTADEGCPCIPGNVQQCFLGPPGHRNADGSLLGACAFGHQTCQGSGEFGSWGDCQGGISPRAETCDNLDNNCDGCADEGLCCTTSGTCPAPGDPRIPTGLPFGTLTVRGNDFIRGASRYVWKVEGGPCDQLLFATSQNVSYRLNRGAGDTQDAEGPNLIFNPTLSGDYTVTLTAYNGTDPALQCTFIIPVHAPGMRVEMCWDTTGTDDLDLWVTKPGFAGDLTYGNSNVCAYWNCDMQMSLWGYPATTGSMASCTDLFGGMSTTCQNPRLDIDNISDPGKPENINLDNPNSGDRFRIDSNYYGGASHTVHPMVNVYCGGTLKATYGGADVSGHHYGADPVSGFNHAGTNTDGSLWRVADVTMTSATDCTVAALHPTGMTGGYCIATNSNRSFAGMCH